VFQRYALGPDGRLQLVGRPTATPLAPFLPPVPFARPDQDPPDAALVALVDRELPHVSTQLTLPVTTDANAAPTENHPRMARAIVDRGEAQGAAVMFAMMGALTAQAACRRMLETDAEARSVVFWYEDRVRVDGEPQPRVRFVVQRRGDPAAAVIEQPVQRSSEGAEVLEGPRAFVGWADSLFPVESKAA
jgi:hypothetical protein